jgi:hypothetical protein
MRYKEDRSREERSLLTCTLVAEGRAGVGGNYVVVCVQLTTKMGGGAHTRAVRQPLLSA